MLLQAAKPTLMKEVIRGVIIQHCSLLPTLYSQLLVLPYMLTCRAFSLRDTLRPDLLLVTSDRKLFVLELIVGFETKLNINSQRKKEKYQQLLQTLNSQFSLIKYVNLSVNCLGILGRSADSFIDMCKYLDVNKDQLRFISRKTSNIIIH